MNPKSAVTHKTSQKKWKKSNLPSSFYHFAKNPAMKKALGGLVVPDHVKAIQISLNTISKNDGILVINDDVDLATILMIMSDKNAKRIKEIRAKNWSAIDFDKINKRHLENIAEFKGLFGLDIPDFIIELHHYHECMSELVQGERNDLSGIYIDGFGSLHAGVFQHVFTDKKPEEKDVLSLRYRNHSLNFFPLFYRDYDYVTQGLIFDHFEGSFSPFIGYGGNEDCARQGIWDCLSDAFDYALQTCESYFDLEEFIYDEINDLLEEEECKDALLIWFYNLATTGYLNFHRMPSIKPNALTGPRYDGYLTEENLKKLSKKNTLFVAEEFAVQYSLYPRLPIRFSKNFNSGFTYELLESLLLVFRDAPVRQNLKRFISKAKNSKSDLMVLMGMPEELQSATKTSQETVDIFFTIVERFCNAETKAGRPYLAFLVGLYAWERMEQQTTKLSARLLQTVPDEICHPIIKAVARLHSETRFDEHIYI